MKKQAADGRLYAAVCASPAVALGSWGLLKGLKVSIRYLFLTFTFVRNHIEWLLIQVLFASC